MYLSEIITKHIEHSFKTVECASVCSVCGKKITQAVRKRDIIKSSFTDYEYLKYKSDYLCCECSALIGQVTVEGKKTWLRNFSFTASETELRVLKREEIQEALFNPPEPPFVFCVTYSNKKQVAVKASLQYSREKYKVYTDKGIADIVPAELKKLSGIISKWYSVIPEKAHLKQSPTYFTKDEILHGTTDLRRIEQYGVSDYFAENKELERHRRTPTLTLLVFAANRVL